MGTLLSAIILENEGFSLNDLTLIQRMALKKVYVGKLDVDNISDKEAAVLDSLVDFGLLDIGYDITPEGEHAASLMDKYSKREREDLAVAKQLAADQKYDLPSEDDYEDDDEFPFTEMEKVVMKAAGLNEKQIAEIFKQKQVVKENFALSKLSHYVVDPRDKEYVTAFELGKCDNCGGEVQEPNSIKTDLEGAKRLKLKRLDHFPPELVPEDDGGTYCQDCVGDVREDEYDEPEDQFRDDVEADADVLASAGWGTDEDYGYFGGDEY